MDFVSVHSVSIGDRFQLLMLALPCLRIQHAGGIRSLSGAGTGELGELRITPVGEYLVMRNATRASPGYFAANIADRHHRPRGQQSTKRRDRKNEWVVSGVCTSHCRCLVVYICSISSHNTLLTVGNRRKVHLTGNHPDRTLRPKDLSVVSQMELRETIRTCLGNHRDVCLRVLFGFRIQFLWFSIRPGRLLIRTAASERGAIHEMEHHGALLVSGLKAWSVTGRVGMGLNANL